MITFTATQLVLRSHNIPNHPTAVFPPDAARVLDGSPNYIREQISTFYIPLEPRRKPEAQGNARLHHARRHPPGPIGVAVNGVVFFDPYDAEAVEAFWRLGSLLRPPRARCSSITITSTPSA